MMSKDARTSVEDVFKSFELEMKAGPAGQVLKVQREPGKANVQMKKASTTFDLQVSVMITAASKSFLI